jgi:phage tail-like protein
MSATPTGSCRNGRLRVEIEGIPDIDFTQVILPEASAEVIEVRNGGDLSDVRKSPGIIKLSNLVLQRGVTGSKDLFMWWTNIANGVSDRRNVVVMFLDEQLQPIMQWKFAKVWPARYYVSPLCAEDQAAFLTETIECPTESFQLA